MSLRPFFEADPAIQIHQIAALLALITGAVVLWRRKGNGEHKFWGRVWVALMLVTAVSSIFIHETRMWGNFSPIHLLTLLVLVNIPLAIWYARQGNIVAHYRMMQGTYIGLVVAGLLTFLPGRINFAILFGEGFGIGGVWGSVIGIVSAASVMAVLLYRRARV